MFSSAQTFAISATDCSFYQTPTPTAAARNESKSGLIISIEKKKKWRHSGSRIYPYGDATS